MRKGTVCFDGVEELVVFVVRKRKRTPCSGSENSGGFGTGVWSLLLKMIFVHDKNATFCMRSQARDAIKNDCDGHCPSCKVTNELWLINKLFTFKNYLPNSNL